LYASLGVLVILVVLVRVMQATSTHTRFLATIGLNKDQQRYWTYDDSLGSKIKKNLLVAPLIRKRHNQEISLSTAVNVGTIPSRLHTIFLLFYILTNVGYCCILDYHQSRPSLLAEARGRTGHLAVMNMLPLFIFSARNNPFIPLLGISFDTFNLFHRWIGRIVVLEALAHTFIWGVNNYDARGLDGLTSHLRTDLFLIYGLISTVAMLAIIIQSVSIIRHAFYESFLHLHQILVVTAIVGLLLHCESQSLPQKPFLYALICLWAFERLIRLYRILHRRGTTVTIEALQGGACRVTFNVQGKWTKSPGKHLYAYIPSVSLWYVS
jgi:predicted ferric reductase